jgi:signal transduction histidine kinase
MERLLDKAIVLACCLPVLALVPISYWTVLALLAATGCSLLVEALEGRIFSSNELVLHAARTAPRAIPVAYCLVACFVPDAALFTALPAYDLARSPKGAWAGLLAILPLACLAGHGAAAATIMAACVVTAASLLLSVRTGHVLEQRAANRQERDLLRGRSLSLEAKNRDLLDRQEYEARLATLSERSRIARDIHDNVGHLITRAVVQTEAFKVVHADDEQISSELGQLSDTLHEALDTLRASVHAMADEACDLSVQVRQAAEDACEGGGLRCECDIEASEATPAVTACLLAVVRESISNTLRHADGATCVRVELVERPGLWRLVVTDDGALPARVATGSSGPAIPVTDGIGLESMSERVRALGGTLTAGFDASAGGFRVFASIPKEDSLLRSGRGADGSQRGRVS